MKKTLIITTLVLITCISVQAQVSTSNNPAQNSPLPSYTLLEPLPCIPSPAAKDINGNTIEGSAVTCSKPGALQETVNFKFYIQYMFNLFIAIAAGAAVFMIVYGGLKYMSTDSWNGKAEGIEKMKNALLGLLLVLTSYIILRTIDPRLVAIPTTLVPALNIKYENANSSLFEALKRDSEKLKVDTAETRKKLEQAETRNTNRQLDIDTAREEIADLKELGATDDDPAVKAIQARIDSLTNEIKRERAGATLILAKSTFDNTIYGVNPLLGNNGPNAFKALRENMDRLYEVQIAKLKAAGAEADQIQEYETYRTYSKIIVDMNEVVAKVAQLKVEYDGSWTPLKTDLAMNQEIVAQQKLAEAELKKIVETKARNVSSNPELYLKITEKETELKGLMNTIRIQ